jgi:hypothetical protein
LHGELRVILWGGWSVSAGDGRNNSKKNLSKRKDQLKKEIAILVGKGILKVKHSIFLSYNAAAKYVLNIITILSTKYDLELGGNLYQSGDRYYYGIPIVGDAAKMALNSSYVGYHTHPSGKFLFSNSFFNSERNPKKGDVNWINSGRNSLYLGVEVGDKVRIGRCDFSKCSNVGYGGTKPSEIIQ